MLDDGGFDYGILTGIGLMIAAAIVLLMVFSIFKATEPGNTAIALESATGQVSGDIGTVAAMAIPYMHEGSYDLNGMDLLVSSDRVTARSGSTTFSRPLVVRIYPGRYVANGTVLWNNTAGFREYLNETFNGTGTSDSPIDLNRSEELHAFMDRCGRSIIESPITVTSNKSVVIEKLFIYTSNSSVEPGGEPYVFVYQR